MYYLYNCFFLPQKGQKFLVRGKKKEERKKIFYCNRDESFLVGAKTLHFQKDAV